MTMRCRHCGDELPRDCPPGVTSCRGYADWRARQKGDLLPTEEADALLLLAGLCEPDVAVRDGLPELPRLPA
jgi:hypothetical protein